MSDLLRFSLLSLAFVASAAAANPLVLRYDAFVGVAHAGVIEVELQRDELGYRVRGEAESRGLMEMLKDTRGWFVASGRFEGGAARSDVYEYYQKDNSKERFISVSGGELKYVKNGRERPAVPAISGTDLVTALWVVRDCANLDQVHTGRRGYSFQLVRDVEGLCEFSVTENDEGEEPFDLSVRYQQRGGFRVPVSIRSAGAWPGHLRLSE